jgi:hypothetical protein
MRPKEVYDNIDNFYEVVDDAMVGIYQARGEGKTNGEIPTLDQELLKFATECKSLKLHEITMSFVVHHASETAWNYYTIISRLFAGLHYPSHCFEYKKKNMTSRTAC